MPYKTINDRSVLRSITLFKCHNSVGDLQAVGNPLRSVTSTFEAAIFPGTANLAEDHLDIGSLLSHLSKAIGLDVAARRCIEKSLKQSIRATYIGLVKQNNSGPEPTWEDIALEEGRLYYSQVRTMSC